MASRCLFASLAVAAVRGSLACVAIGALGLACASDPESGGTTATPSACATSIAGGPWWNQAFSDQTRRFHVEFDATPSAAPLDAVVGLSDGVATSFTQLGPIVRWSLAGTLEARDGSIYRADVTQPYQAGTAYHVRLDVDVRSHTYSVWVRGEFGGYTAIARNYAFRTEQAGVRRLNHVATKLDSASGALTVCNFQMVSDDTTADGCLVARAGDGFVTAILPNATVLDTLTFTATPSAPNIDAVIGLSAGPATRFSDLATAVRFAPSGVIDVRDGGAYRADVTRPYGTSPLNFRMIADLTSHRYSVFEGTFSGAVELARQYAFRTEQRAVTHLDRLSAIVDSPQGSVAICGFYSAPSVGVVYSREGNYAVAPLANDQALVSDGATTLRLDPGGRVLAQVPRGGELAVDGQGNVAIASVAGTILTVDSYDARLAPRWHAAWAVPAGAGIDAITIAPSGTTRVGLVSWQVSPAPQVIVVSIAPGGGAASQQTFPGEAVAFDGDQAIVAWNDQGTLRVTRYAATGATVWSRAFTGSAGITAITVDPAHAVIFGGELYTPIDFGGGALPLEQNPDGMRLNAFVIKLSATGAHVFSKKTGYTLVGGIASNGSRIAVSGTWRTQFRYEELQLLDASGAPLATHFDTGFGEFGIGGSVAMGASGRVWWNLQTQWPLFPSWPYLVVLTP